MTLSLSTSPSVVDGVRERAFAVDDIPGLIWDAGEGPGSRPLVLLAHGGGQHKAAPGITARAWRFVAELGATAVAIDAPGHGDRPRDPELATQGAGAAAEWRTVLDGLAEADLGTGAVGFWGVSMGCATGIALVAAEPRITAAVLGLAGGDGLATLAARITVPVEFVVQWDDELVPRESALALFDAFGSADKSLHANAGGHLALPRFEVDSAVRFFARHLG